MRRWIEFVAVLYPRSWREEFGPEFGALLDDVKPSWRVFRNVLGGSIEMQITAGTNWMKVAGAMAAIGAVVAFGISFRTAPLYSSSAVISVTPQVDPVRPTSRDVLQTRAAERVAGMEAELLSRTSLSSIINDPRLQLYEEERKREPLEDVIGEMRRNIRIEAFPPADGGLAPLAFNISFSYPDQVKAQAAVRALSNKFLEANVRTNKANADAYQGFWRDMADVQHTKPAPPPPIGDIVGVLSPASNPVDAEGPNRFLFLAWGLGMGLLVGLLAAFGMRRPRGVRRLVGFGVAGFTLAGAGSFLIPNRFTSSAFMQISPAQVTEDPMAPLPAATPAAEFLRQILPEVLSFQNLSQMIQDRRLNLYAEERAGKPMEEIVRNMVANDLQHCSGPCCIGSEGLGFGVQYYLLVFRQI